jgi:hypothetical protein
MLTPSAGASQAKKVNRTWWMHSSLLQVGTTAPRIAATGRDASPRRPGRAGCHRLSLTETAASTPWFDWHFLSVILCRTTCHFGLTHRRKSILFQLTASRGGGSIDQSQSRWPFTRYRYGGFPVGVCLCPQPPLRRRPGRLGEASLPAASRNFYKLNSGPK